MTNEERKRLEAEQEALMRQYEIVEANPDLFGHKYNSYLHGLDIEADKIRWILEGDNNDI